MKRERIEKEEIKQVVRMEGISTMEKVEAVILESNGKFSVLTDYSKGEKSTIKK